MKFQVLQENLQAGLRTVQPAMGTRTVRPVLNNILLTATDTGRLVLSATDLESRLDHHMGGSIDEPGATTVPGRLLLDFVNSLPSEAIGFNLNSKTSRLEVTCGGNVAVIDCIPASEFPLAPQFEEDAHFATLEGDVFGTMLKRALVGASKDREPRPILASLLLSFKGADLTMAGADGYRLSVCSEKFDGEAWESKAVLVPAWAFSTFKGLRGNEVQIFVNDKIRAAFRLEHTDLTVQLVEGRFPDYNQIIPQKYDTQTTVNTADLVHVCKMARVFARYQAEIVCLEIRDDSLKVISTASEIGGVNAEIPAKVEGKETWLDIAFNVKFLLEALSVMGSEEVVIQTTMSNGPALFKPAGEKEDRFKHVLMPMSLNTLSKAVAQL